MEMLACLVLAGYLARCVADIVDRTNIIRQTKGELPSVVAMGVMAVVMIAYIGVVVEYADEAISVAENAIGDLNIWKWAAVFAVVGILGQIIRFAGIAAIAASQPRL